MATELADTVTPPGAITRRWGKNTAVAVHTDLASCDVIDMRFWGAASVKPPASVTSLTFYGCETESGTFVKITGAGTDGVVTVTASQWTAFPDAVYAHGYVKLLSAGSTGDATVVFKS